jgi:hypothetical protein
MKSFNEFVTEGMVNVGTQKWPLYAKKSSKGKVSKFEAPSNGKGDHMIHHDGETYIHTGKKGTHKSGEASYEYKGGKEGEDKRVWVRKSGHVESD